MWGVNDVDSASDSRTEAVCTSMSRARAQILLYIGTSYALFGIYLALFCLTLWSSCLSKDGSKAGVQRRMRWAIFLTASCIMFRQVMSTLAITNACSWTTLAGQMTCAEDTHVIPDAKTLCGQSYYESNLHWVSLLANLYVPPVVAYLSDSTLAWRVYMLWGRPRWLFYILIGCLTAVCAVGLSSVMQETHHLAEFHSITIHESHWRDTGPNSTFYDNSTLEYSYSASYSAWAWITLLMNSVLSASILIRIGQLGRISNRGLLRRVRAIAGTVIETALLSWFGVMSCAIVWSIDTNGYYLPTPQAQNNSTHTLSRSDTQVQINSTTVLPFLVNGPDLHVFKTLVNVALPYLMAISQALIIAQANLLKFATTEGFVKTLSVITEDWNMPSQVNLANMASLV